MSLSKYTKPATKKTATIQLEGSNISFTITYVNRTTFRAITDASTTQKYSQANKGPIPTVDAEKLLRSYLEVAVTGWKNVTPRALASFMYIDLDSMPAEEIDKEVPFTLDDLYTVVSESKVIEEYLFVAPQQPSLFNMRHLGHTPEEAEKKEAELEKN